MVCQSGEILGLFKSQIATLNENSGEWLPLADLNYIGPANAYKLFADGEAADGSIVFAVGDRLLRWERGSDKTDLIRTIDGRRVEQLAIDGDDIWFTTRDSLDVLRAGNKQPTEYSWQREISPLALFIVMVK